MGVANIVTDRLIIIPITHSIACSILNRDTKAFDKMGVNLNGKWPVQDTLDILNFIKDTLSPDDEVNGFDVWMIVKKENMTAIGDAGFKGEPDENGAIEIGFGISEDEHRNGYGYEAASALINWASQNDTVKVIKADCLLDNLPSIKLLEKCGMRETNRDDELIYWDKKVSK
jgi:ribosomal-protein-alanine N-acetyltransferase